MKYNNFVIQLVIGLISITFSSALFNSNIPGEFDRNISVALNPNCPDYICSNNLNNTITLVYIRANSATDSIHYLWDFTGKPSILVAVTNLNSTLSVDWDSFLNGNPNSIAFSENPIYSFITIINTIWQFDDPDDIGELRVKNDTKMYAYNLRELTWNRTYFSHDNNQVSVDVSANVNGSDMNQIQFKFKSFASKGNGENFPHLLHISNTTQIDIVLKNLTNLFNSPRIAIELYFVVTEKFDEKLSFNISERRGLDDEHTPGIFEIIDILSPNTVRNGNGGYIEYRPVSYTHHERDVSTSTETHLSLPMLITTPSIALQETLAYSIYGAKLDSFLVQSVNISFGESEDGFYSKSNYTTWTFVMGYGVPPIQELSSFVVIIATVGLGLPLVLLLIGGCFICIRNARNKAERI
uniref:Putative lysosomal protein ncu-g1 n=1 Tax=Corethrella appendiculata TaxID=1370023 RepID=U5EN62_9DIPT